MSLPKFKAHRTVKPLPFVKPVGAKKSVKAVAAKKPAGIKRKLSLSKYPEPADSHTKEHQASNYLAYEVKAGTRVKGK
jgi:hypothetical protein